MGHHLYLLKRKRFGLPIETVASIENLKDLSEKLKVFGFEGAKRELVAGHICYRNKTEVLYLEYRKTNRQEELA